MGALEPKFWAAFCDVIGRPDFAFESRDPDTRSGVAEIIATRSRDEWEVLFRDADACAEIVRSPGAALGHPQARHRGQTPGELTLPLGLRANALGGAPILGEHDDEILRPLG